MEHRPKQCRERPEASSSKRLETDDRSYRSLPSCCVLPKLRLGFDEGKVSLAVVSIEHSGGSYVRCEAMGHDLVYRSIGV